MTVQYYQHVRKFASTSSDNTNNSNNSILKDINIARELPRRYALVFSETLLYAKLMRDNR